MTVDVLKKKSMPITNSNPKPYVRFAVPDALLQDAKDLADAEGYNEAEFHRLIWTIGLNAYAESSNKRLVNKKLRAGLKGAAGADSADS